jgi:hypothetical protein
MESTLRFLEEPLLGEQDLDTKIRSLLEAEYLRRLGRYRRLDHTLAQKYGMTFEEFLERRVVQQKGYTWDMEKDAMDWETAVDGMRTMERKLQELGQSYDAPDKHEPLPEGLEPRPLLKFMARVEDLLLQYDLL